MHIRKAIFFFCCIFTLISGCATNPITGDDELMFYSVQDDTTLGREMAPAIEAALDDRIPDDDLQLYINRVGQRIARVCHHPEWEYRYIATEHDMVNALALPGGYIYITRGLLERLTSEAQLAAVLAHETAHVVGRHTASQLSKQTAMNLATTALLVSGDVPSEMQHLAVMTNQVLTLSYSREDETEADRAGLDYMVQAGYEPNAMVEVLETLQKEHRGRRELEFYSTHPYPETRLYDIRRRIAEHYRHIDSAITNEDVYKNNVLDYLTTDPKPPKKRPTQTPNG